MPEGGGPPVRVPVPPPTPRKLAGETIASTALVLQGVRYHLGGADPSGFDCSGLVHYVFAQFGIEVPRQVHEQYRAGERVKPTQIKPGDLLFFSTKGPGPTHVAIAIGGDRFVHAPTWTGVVRVEALSSSYWGSRYLGARRIASD